MGTKSVVRLHSLGVCPGKTYTLVLVEHGSIRKGCVVVFSTAWLLCGGKSFRGTLDWVPSEVVRVGALPT